MPGQRSFRVRASSGGTEAGGGGGSSVKGRCLREASPLASVSAMLSNCTTPPVASETSAGGGGGGSGSGSGTGSSEESMTGNNNRAHSSASGTNSSLSHSSHGISINAAAILDPITGALIRRGRGRPKGSKNKEKPPGWVPNRFKKSEISLGAKKLKHKHQKNGKFNNKHQKIRRPAKSGTSQAQGQSQDCSLTDLSSTSHNNSAESGSGSGSGGLTTSSSSTLSSPNGNHHQPASYSIVDKIAKKLSSAKKSQKQLQRASNANKRSSKMINKQQSRAKKPVEDIPEDGQPPVKDDTETETEVAESEADPFGFTSPPTSPTIISPVSSSLSSPQPQRIPSSPNKATTSAAARLKHKSTATLNNTASRKRQLGNNNKSAAKRSTQKSASRNRNRGGNTATKRQKLSQVQNIEPEEEEDDEDDEDVHDEEDDEDEEFIISPPRSRSSVRNRFSNQRQRTTSTHARSTRSNNKSSASILQDSKSHNNTPPPAQRSSLDLLDDVMDEVIANAAQEAEDIDMPLKPPTSGAAASRRQQQARKQVKFDSSSKSSVKSNKSSIKPDFSALEKEVFLDFEILCFQTRDELLKYDAWDTQERAERNQRALEAAKQSNTALGGQNAKMETFSSGIMYNRKGKLMRKLKNLKSNRRLINSYIKTQNSTRPGGASRAESGSPLTGAADKLSRSRGKKEQSQEPIPLYLLRCQQDDVDPAELIYDPQWPTERISLADRFSIPYLVGLHDDLIATAAQREESWHGADWQRQLSFVIDDEYAQDALIALDPEFALLGQSDPHFAPDALCDDNSSQAGTASSMCDSICGGPDIGLADGMGGTMTELQDERIETGSNISQTSASSFHNASGSKSQTNNGSNSRKSSTSGNFNLPGMAGSGRSRREVRLPSRLHDSCIGYGSKSSFMVADFKSAKTDEYEGRREKYLAAQRKLILGSEPSSLESSRRSSLEHFQELSSFFVRLDQVAGENQAIKPGEFYQTHGDIGHSQLCYPPHLYAAGPNGYFKICDQFDNSGHGGDGTQPGTSAAWMQTAPRGLFANNHFNYNQDQLIPPPPGLKSQPMSVPISVSVPPSQGSGQPGFGLPPGHPGPMPLMGNTGSAAMFSVPNISSPSIVVDSLHKLQLSTPPHLRSGGSLDPTSGATGSTLEQQQQQLTAGFNKPTPFSIQSFQQSSNQENTNKKSIHDMRVIGKKPKAWRAKPSKPTSSVGGQEAPSLMKKKVKVASTFIPSDSVVDAFPILDEQQQSIQNVSLGQDSTSSPCKPTKESSSQEPDPQLDIESLPNAEVLVSPKRVRKQENYFFRMNEEDIKRAEEKLAARMDKILKTDPSSDQLVDDQHRTEVNREPNSETEGELPSTSAASSSHVNTELAGSTTEQQEDEDSDESLLAGALDPGNIHGNRTTQIGWKNNTPLLRKQIKHGYMRLLVAACPDLVSELKERKTRLGSGMRYPGVAKKNLLTRGKEAILELKKQHVQLAKLKERMAHWNKVFRNSKTILEQNPSGPKVDAIKEKIGGVVDKYPQSQEYAMVTRNEHMRHALASLKTDVVPHQTSSENADPAAQAGQQAAHPGSHVPGASPPHEGVVTVPSKNGNKKYLLNTAQNRKSLMKQQSWRKAKHQKNQNHQNAQPLWNTAAGMTTKAATLLQSRQNLQQTNPGAMIPTMAQQNFTTQPGFINKMQPSLTLPGVNYALNPALVQSLLTANVGQKIRFNPPPMTPGSKPIMPDKLLLTDQAGNILGALPMPSSQPSSQTQNTSTSVTTSGGAPSMSSAGAPPGSLPFMNPLQAAALRGNMSIRMVAPGQLALVPIDPSAGPSQLATSMPSMLMSMPHHPSTPITSTPVTATPTSQPPQLKYGPTGQPLPTSSLSAGMAGNMPVVFTYGTIPGTSGPGGTSQPGCFLVMPTDQSNPQQTQQLTAVTSSASAIASQVRSQQMFNQTMPAASALGLLGRRHSLDSMVPVCTSSSGGSSLLFSNSGLTYNQGMFSTATGGAAMVQRIGTFGSLSTATLPTINLPSLQSTPTQQVPHTKTKLRPLAAKQPKDRSKSSSVKHSASGGGGDTVDTDSRSTVDSDQKNLSRPSSQCPTPAPPTSGQDQVTIPARRHSLPAELDQSPSSSPVKSHDGTSQAVTTQAGGPEADSSGSNTKEVLSTINDTESLAEGSEDDPDEVSLQIDENYEPPQEHPHEKQNEKDGGVTVEQNQQSVVDDSPPAEADLKKSSSIEVIQEAEQLNKDTRTEEPESGTANQAAVDMKSDRIQTSTARVNYTMPFIPPPISFPPQSGTASRSVCTVPLPYDGLTTVQNQILNRKFVIAIEPLKAEIEEDLHQDESSSGDVFDAASSELPSPSET